MNRSHTIRIALLVLACVGDLPGDIHAAEPDSALSTDLVVGATVSHPKQQMLHAAVKWRML